MSAKMDSTSADARIAEAMESLAGAFAGDDKSWHAVIDRPAAEYGRNHDGAEPRRLSFAIAAAIALLAMAVAAGVSLSAGESDPSERQQTGVASESSANPTEAPSTDTTTTAPPSTSTEPPPDVTEMEIPPGKVPVADHYGGIAGFIDADVSASPEGYPPLDLPSEAEVRGVEVTDVDGVLVGYFMESFGFVTRAVAERPGGIDDLIATRQAEIENLPPEIQAQIDDIHEQIDAAGEGR